MRRHILLLAILLGSILPAIPNAREAATINLWSLRYAAEVHDLSRSQSALPSLPDAHPRAAFWRALRAIDSGDGQKALTLLEPLATEGDRIVLSVMGLAYELLGDFPAAIQVWRQTGNARSLLRIARQGGHLDDSLEAYYAAWEVDPEEGAEPLADFLGRRKEDYAAAEAVLREALAAYPFSRRRDLWLHRLAGVLNAQKRPLEAVEVLRQIVSENPDYWQAHISLGRMYYYYLDYGLEAALDEFRLAIAADPSQGSGYVQIGEVLVSGGRYVEALEAYQEAIDRSPDYSPAYYGMAWAYLRNDQAEQAMAAIEQALILDPSEIKYYARAGSIYEFAGETEKALAAYRQVLTSDPNNRTALEALERLTNNQ